MDHDDLARRSPRGARERLLLAVGLVLALAVGALLRIDAVDAFYGPNQHQRADVERYYLGTAESFLSGRGWTPALEYNFIPPPGQAVFIVALKKIRPAIRYGQMRGVQAAISSATIALAFWVGLELGSPWIGLVAAWLLAVDTRVALYVGSLLPVTNYLLLLFGFLACLLTALRRSSTGLLAASGALLGLTSLMKAFPLALGLVIPLYLLLRERRRRGLVAAGAFFLAFAAIVAPWTLRNHARYGRPYLVSTNSGTLLAQSNFLALDSARTLFWTDALEEDWENAEIRERFEGLRDAEGRLEWNRKDDAYFRHFLRYATQHPLHFLRNGSIKLFNALRYPPPPGRPWRASDSWHAAVLLAGLAGLGWFAVAERRSDRWVMVVVTGYFAAFTALFHITKNGRINLPLKVLIGFFAAYAVVGVCRAFGISRASPARRR